MGDGGETEPYRNVRMTGYWISEAVITNGQIEKVASPVRAEHNLGDDQPACGRIYSEIIEIIDLLSSLDGVDYLLPTDAQWECAARAGLESKLYPWGDQMRGERKRAQIVASSTADVLSFPPNRYGMYGATGNVEQLVREAYFVATVASAGELIVDPIGIGEDSDWRMTRGGSFTMITSPVRDRYPQPFDDHTLWSKVGFRLALEDSKELQAAAVIEKGSRVSD